MIISTNFRQKFYEEIRKEHTLIIVNADVDALCASIILTYALSCDHATFSLSPVDSWHSVERAIAENREQLRNIVFLNCGASKPLGEIAENANTKIFVLDSHRPVHLENIYSTAENPVNVLITSAEVEEWNVPDASQIFENDEDGSDDEPTNEEGASQEVDDDDTDVDGEEEASRLGDGGGNVTPPRRNTRDIASLVERRALQSQRAANWKRNRATILWQYYMNAWHSTSSAVFMLELVHELGKSSAPMLWCAAVGLNSQLMDQLISIDAYTSVCIERMRAFIRKFAPRKPIEQTRADGIFRITFDKELILPLYSHWSIYQSICNDSMFVCQSKLWSQKGEHNLRHILAKLGLTLSECKQDYESLNSDRRAEVFAILEKFMDANFATFNAYFAYASHFNAADFARVLALRLETRARGGKPRSLYDRFADAKSILSSFLKFGGRVTQQIESMTDRYKTALVELTSLAFVSVNQGHIVSTTRYYLLDLQQNLSVSYLSSRHCINLFAHLLQRAFASTKNARRASKPLVISLPLSVSMLGEGAAEAEAAEVRPPNAPNGGNSSNAAAAAPPGWYLIVGVMPLTDILADTQRKSVIGRVFDHVANEAKIEMQPENFDSNFIRIRGDDRAKFFNSLEAKFEIG